MGSSGRTRRLLIALALLGPGCGSSRTRALAPTGPASSDGVVVESATLVTVGDRGNDFVDAHLDLRRCHVQGFLRNDTPRNRSVTVTFTALDPGGAPLGAATAPHNLVPAGGRTRYEAEFGTTLTVAGPTTLEFPLFGGCAQVHRFDITAIDVEPA